MAARKSIGAIVNMACDGGEVYKPLITVELRLNFPPNTVAEEEVLMALAQAVQDVTADIARYPFRRTDVHTT